MLNKGAILLSGKKSPKSTIFAMEVEDFPTEQGQARGYDKALGYGGISPNSFLGVEINQFVLRFYDDGSGLFAGPEFSKLRFDDALNPAPAQIQLTLRNGIAGEETVFLDMYTESLFIGDPVRPYYGGLHEVVLTPIY